LILKKKNIYVLFRSLFLVSAVAFGQADHIVFSEVVLTPSDGEYVEITNPTANDIDMSDYYLTDATDGSGNAYYNLPSGTGYWSGSSSDFICRFPSDYSLSAGVSIKVSLRDNDSYVSTYGESADLSLNDNLLDAVDGSNTKGNAAAPKLSNTSETLVLFYWDGTSSTVKDVDYLLWGDNSFAVDKSGISGYQSDTPVSSQFYMSVHTTNEKLIRLESASEGSESQSGGNGITGHDETSEPLSETWTTASLVSSKPDISGLSLTPASPNTEDVLVFEVTVTDDEGIASVNLKYEFQSESLSLPMSESGSSVYSVQVGPLGASGSLIYSVLAEDITGIKDSTSKLAITISEPQAVLTIAGLLNDFDSYIGQEVEINGVVTVPSGILRSDRVQVFIQDNSKRGILLESPQSGESLNRGDSIKVNGVLSAYVSDYDDLQPQLSDATISILKQNADIPIVNLEFINVFNEIVQIIDPEDLEPLDVIKYMNTYVKFYGKIVSREDNLGGGTNITLQDQNGAFTTVRIWNSTNILYDSAEDLINYELDSLLRIGNNIEIAGIAGQYRGGSQIQPAYNFDIVEKLEGIIGDYRAELSVSPYPFVPQLGEVIKYSYRFPSNARIKLRVFDTAGRLITTLYDEYRGISFYKEATWNGRDNLNKLVPGGTYIIHLDIIDSITGKNYQKVAPVVIAVYKN
jgi:hypothetical protein